MPLSTYPNLGHCNLDRDFLKRIIDELKRELRRHPLKFLLQWNTHHGCHDGDENGRGRYEYTAVYATLYYRVECENRPYCRHRLIRGDCATFVSFFDLVNRQNESRPLENFRAWVQEETRKLETAPRRQRRGSDSFSDDDDGDLPLSAEAFK